MIPPGPGPPGGDLSLPHGGGARGNAEPWEGPFRRTFIDAYIISNEPRVVETELNPRPWWIRREIRPGLGFLSAPRLTLEVLRSPGARAWG